VTADYYVAFFRSRLPNFSQEQLVFLTFYDGKLLSNYVELFNHAYNT